jgi:hypothetical protein
MTDGFEGATAASIQGNANHGPHMGNQHQRMKSDS